jgi:predicted RecA/RadA family phage recombinase
VKNFIQRGDVLDVVLAADAKSGDVVAQGNLIGIANTDGKLGETIAVTIEGVVSVPKAAATAFTQGGLVTWDDTANAAVASGGVSMGYAAAMPAPNAVEVWVKLTPTAA